MSLITKFLDKVIYTSTKLTCGGVREEKITVRKVINNLIAISLLGLLLFLLSVIFGFIIESFLDQSFLTDEFHGKV